MTITTRTRTARATRIAAALAVPALALSLTACGKAPWQVAGAVTTPAPKPTATALATPTPAPTIQTIQNDLAAGSTQRELAAGSMNLTVDYWSTLNMQDWTAGANKPVSFSLNGTLQNDKGQKFYLSRVSMAVAVSGPDGALSAPAAVVDSASVSPGYLIKAPYSYSQTFVLPPIDSHATSVTLTFNYEVLLQSTPTSTDYAKQTASDTLTIAIAKGA